MQFSSLFLATVFACLASAENKLVFHSLDDQTRVVVTTSNDASQKIADIEVPGNSKVELTLPDNFKGNSYAYIKGGDSSPGMLAEVAFQAWGDLTFFDVSAIVDPSDHDNVSEMYPADAPNTPTSGCSVFPCNNAYYVWDDVQTKSTTQNTIIVTLHGNNAVSSKRDEPEDVHIENFPHSMVTGGQ